MIENINFTEVKELNEIYAQQYDRLKTLYYKNIIADHFNKLRNDDNNDKINQLQQEINLKMKIISLGELNKLFPMQYERTPLIKFRFILFLNNYRTVEKMEIVNKKLGDILNRRPKHPPPPHPKQHRNEYIDERGIKHVYIKLKDYSEI
jgi:hypothetical protein